MKYAAAQPDQPHIAHKLSCWHTSAQDFGRTQARRGSDGRGGAEAKTHRHRCARAARVPTHTRTHAPRTAPTSHVHPDPRSASGKRGPPHREPGGHLRGGGGARRGDKGRAQREPAAGAAVPGGRRRNGGGENAEEAGQEVGAARGRRRRAGWGTHQKKKHNTKTQRPRARNAKRGGGPYKIHVTSGSKNGSALYSHRARAPPP